MKKKLKLYAVVGKDEWGQSERTGTFWAVDAKDAKNQAMLSRSMDGGIVSARLVKPPKHRSLERGGPNDR